MNALLLIAHGSRQAASNQEILALAARLGGGAFARVVPCFLEMATPDIPTAADQLVAAGATDILVLPYFLAAGRHVGDDVPTHIRRLQQRHPVVRFTLAPHIGAAAAMPEFIHAHLQP